MGRLATWQLASVLLVAVLSLGFMSYQIIRLQFRESDGVAVARPGDDVESGLYGARAKAGSEVFDGFSYRVGARFAGRARVVVDGERISLCAPRGPAGLYWLWIWLQGLTLAAVAPLLVWALVALDWRMLLWSLGMLVVSVLVMAIGAGVWPGLGETPGLGDGHYPTLEHSIADAREVTMGPGWASGGLSWVLLPYVKGIDQLAIDHAVSWWGPDERGREVRYAMHCYDEAQAKRLYDLLTSEAATAGQ